MPPEVKKHAEDRARYLVEAYDVEEGAKEAFISDMALELIQFGNAMLEALDEVQAANARVMAGAAVNRQARRALQKKFKVSQRMRSPT